MSDETMTSRASGEVATGDRRAEVAAHTPGPWQIAQNKWNAKRHDPWTDAIKIEGDVNENWVVPPLVCVTYRGEGNEANARLIAAAPDMLTALRAVVSVADRKTVEFDAARAAIFKATGETP